MPAAASSSLLLLNHQATRSLFLRWFLSVEKENQKGSQVSIYLFNFFFLYDDGLNIHLSTQLPHHTDKHSAPSPPGDVPNVRPVMVDTRPEILVLSSAIRDGLNQDMQPVNTTLEALSRTVIALQHKLHPPSHYGLGSEASTSIDVTTPPSAFRRPGRQLPSMSRAPPSPFAELGVHTAPPSHASAGLGAAPLPPPPSRSGHG